MPRLAPNLIRRSQLAATQFAEGFDGDIHSDFAAEFEAVRNRPGRGENADADSFDEVCLDTPAEGRIGQKNEPQPQRIHAWTPGGTRHREPYFSGKLRSEIVKVQRGKQAHHTALNSLAHFGQTVVLGDILIRRAIEAACMSDNQAARDEP